MSNITLESLYSQKYIAELSNKIGTVFCVYSNDLENLWVQINDTYEMWKEDFGFDRVTIRVKSEKTKKKGRETLAVFEFAGTYALPKPANIYSLEDHLKYGGKA